ncbi:CAP domain-containing protein [Streptomyces sp. UG1]|uniref:CAP domain-containing protein n=1 Tax=Streptomyces sp. UG1 TaxID=3417652 RepID=UPI003CFA4980
MGRHRRSAAGRAATGRATGVTHTDGSYTEGHDPRDSYASDRPTRGIAPYLNPEAYAEAYARSDAYLFATDDDYARLTDTTTFPAQAGSISGSDAGAAFRSGGFAPEAGPRRPGGMHRRRKKKAAVPVKTGLLGASAAVAIGTVAVASGMVPGLDNYQLGGGNGPDRVQAADTPTNTPAEQGGTSGSADRDGSGDATSRGAGRPASPAPSTSPAAPTKTPSKKPSATPSEKPEGTPSRKATKAPAPEKTKEPQKERSSAPVQVSAESAAAAEVLKLVNEERAQAGCSPVAANSSLTDLAQAFSEDMAERGFFDHTSPDGASPWDRAAKAGITDLGGENIARGQADAAAVMDAWMNSPGHQANILNCDFKTLGVGVHFGAGGPWWTQDFGY